MRNIKTDHKILAKHFEDKFSSDKSAIEAMRQLKRKYEATKTGLWSVYVSAYNISEAARIIKNCQPTFESMAKSLKEIKKLT